MNRKRLTTKQREELYNTEASKALAAGRGSYPICKLCGISIFPGQKWHDNHDQFLPHALGGERDGISHKRCNERHNNEVDTPLVAKVKRIRQKFIGAWRPRTRLPGGRDDPRKRTMSGQVVNRATGEPWSIRR